MDWSGPAPCPHFRPRQGRCRSSGSCRLSCPHRITSQIPLGSIVAATLQGFQLGNQVAADRLDLRRIVDIMDAEDDVLCAGVGELAEAIDDLRRRLAGEIDALECRALDLVRVASDFLAMLAKHLVLVMDRRRAAEDVGRVGVLGDDQEGLPLAAATDHDRDPWPRDRLRRVHQSPCVVLAAVELAFGAALAKEHLVGDLERLVEHLESLAEWRERKAESLGFFLVPGGTDPEPGPTTRQDVERRGGFDPQARFAVVDATDHQPEPSPRRVRGHEPERRPALEHRVLGRADATDLEEVVHDPDRVKTDIVGLAGDAAQRRADRSRAAGPGERGNLQADLHRTCLRMRGWAARRLPAGGRSIVGCTMLAARPKARRIPADYAVWGRRVERPSVIVRCGGAEPQAPGRDVGHPSRRTVREDPPPSLPARRVLSAVGGITVATEAAPQDVEPLVVPPAAIPHSVMLALVAVTLCRLCSG